MPGKESEHLRKVRGIERSKTGYKIKKNKSITAKKVKEVINNGETLSRKQLKHLENLSLIEK